MAYPRPAPPSAETAWALAAGMTRLKAGDLSGAEAIFAGASAATPGSVGLAAALATVRNLLHKYKEARQIAENGLRRVPMHPVLLTELGNALAGLGKPGPAKRAFAQALKVAPNMLSAVEGLGQAAYAMGDFRASAAAWQQVCAARPDYTQGLLHLGHALRAAGQPDAAICAFAKIPESDPVAAEAAYGEGCAEQHLGHTEAAKAALSRAIALRPDICRYHRMLAGLKTFTPNDPQLIQLQKLAEKPDTLPVTEQIELHFALARAYEDMKAYARSFQHLKTANAIKRSQITYDESEQLRIPERIRRAWPAKVFTFPSGGCSSDVPIFIIGMPRSGTSLMEQILASHPDVAGAGETTLFGQSLRACHFDPLGMKVPDAPGCRTIGTRYAAALHALSPGAKHVVDKMPGNFLYAGLIHRTLPQAKLIHMQRTPLDCCFSCFATLFTAGHHYAYDLAELGRYYRAYQGLMTHWQAVLPPECLLTVRYEDLVADLAGTVRQVLRFCGLEWDNRCLDFSHTERVVLTASAAQVRRPLFTRGVGRAAPYSAELAPLKTILG